MLLIAAMLMTFLAAQYHHRFTVDPIRAAPAIASLIALGSELAIGRCTARTRLAAGATAFLQMTLFTLLGVLLAYALAANS